MSVRSEVALCSPLEQVDPVPQRRQGCTLRDVDVEHRGQGLGRLGGQHLSAYDLLAGHKGSTLPRLTSWRAITLSWISLVPSPTIISGASRK